MKLASRFAVLFVVAGLCAASATAKDPAAKKKDKPAKPLKAFIVKVDGTSLVVRTGKGDKAVEQTLTTDANTAVTIDDVAAKLTDLKKEMKATITQANGVVTKIEAAAKKKKKDGDAPEAPKAPDAPKAPEVPKTPAA